MRLLWFCCDICCVYIYHWWVKPKRKHRLLSPPGYLISVLVSRGECPRFSDVRATKTTTHQLFRIFTLLWPNVVNLISSCKPFFLVKLTWPINFFLQILSHELQTPWPQLNINRILQIMYHFNLLWMLNLATILFLGIIYPNV